MRGALTTGGRKHFASVVEMYGLFNLLLPASQFPITNHNEKPIYARRLLTASVAIEGLSKPSCLSGEASQLSATLNESQSTAQGLEDELQQLRAEEAENVNKLHELSDSLAAAACVVAARNYLKSFLSYSLPQCTRNLASQCIYARPWKSRQCLPRGNDPASDN